MEHDVNTVEKLNSRIEAGEFLEIVRESELAYQQELDLVVSSIIGQKNDGFAPRGEPDNGYIVPR